MLERPWNAVAEHATARRGYLAAINGDPLRVTYAYGARYQRLGYEPHVHEAFTRRIEAGMVVIDVGAHIGFFTLAAALRVGPSGRVFAFEPAPDTAALLDRHVRYNGWEDRVEVVRQVVSDRPGTVSFYTHHETMSAALFSENVDVLSPEVHESPAGRIEVGATTLDDFCRERGVVPDRVKLDVEGAELAVLRGAQTLLAGQTEFLIEVHPDGLPYLGGSVDELLETIRDAGRSFRRVGEPNNLGIYHLLVQARGSRGRAH